MIIHKIVDPSLYLFEIIFDQTYYYTTLLLFNFIYNLYNKV